MKDQIIDELDKSKTLRNRLKVTSKGRPTPKQGRNTIYTRRNKGDNNQEFNIMAKKRRKKAKFDAINRKKNQRRGKR